MTPREGNHAVPSTGQRVLSIGHSNQSLSGFLELLKAHSVDVLVDVRSRPFSRYVPHFNAEPLRRAVTDAGLRYLFLGNELGGRPDGSEFYDEEGFVLYDRVAGSPSFLDGIQRLENGAKKYRVALMCSEEDPTDCHRRLLIGRVLNSRGIAMDHIRAGGRIESDAEVEERSRPRDAEQLTLFEAPKEPSWKSVRSVSPRSPQASSSGY